DDLGEGFALTAMVMAPADPLDVCELMRTALERLVSALRTAGHTRLAELDVLPETRRRLVVETWNATRAPFPAESCVHRLFEARGAATPQAVAVEHDGRTLTYAELNAGANRLAHRLRALGVRPDARVAICAERGVEMVVGLLGVLKAGGAYVPLDPAY